MKTYRVKLLHKFKHPYPPKLKEVCVIAGLRTCAIQMPEGGRVGGLLLPDRYVAIPFLNTPFQVPVAFQQGTITTGSLDYTDDEVTLLRVPICPNIPDEYGLDHTLAGDFLYSFHEQTLYVWEKLPNVTRVGKVRLFGVSVPLFSEDKHFVGFMIYNDERKFHDVITDLNLERKD